MLDDFLTNQTVPWSGSSFDPGTNQKNREQAFRDMLISKQTRTFTHLDAVVPGQSGIIEPIAVILIIPNSEAY